MVSAQQGAPPQRQPPTWRPALAGAAAALSLSLSAAVVAPALMSAQPVLVRAAVAPPHQRCPQFRCAKGDAPGYRRSRTHRGVVVSSPCTTRTDPSMSCGACGVCRAVIPSQPQHSSTSADGVRYGRAQADEGRLEGKAREKKPLNK